MSEAKRIFVVAGEHSGDVLGGKLLQADCGGKAGRAGADDHDIELHRLPGRTPSIRERHRHFPQAIGAWFDRSRPPGASRSAFCARRALLQMAAGWHRLRP